MSMPFESAIGDAKEFVSKSAEQNPQSDANESPASAERFFDQHAHSATRYAMSIIRRWADAEEIVQDAFCKLLQQNTMDETTTESESKAFLFAIVRNLSIDKLRSQGRRRFEPVDPQQLISTDNSRSEERLEELEQGISRAMLDLPIEWAEALQLKVNGGLSYAEIANVLSATHSQIRTWIFRARKQLQVDLRQAGLLES